MNTIPLYKFVAFSIDFKGSILLSVTKIRDSASYTTAAMVSISNTSRQLLVEFQKTVGFGNVPQEPNYSPDDAAPIYRWHIRQSEALIHLPAINEFLILKRNKES